MGRKGEGGGKTDIHVDFLILRNKKVSINANARVYGCRVVKTASFCRSEITDGTQKYTEVKKNLSSKYKKR